MAMKTLKFAKGYSKLSRQVFYTIRLESPLEVNDTVEVMVEGKKMGSAKVKYIETVNISDLGDDFLLKDTDTDSREEAIDHLCMYYPSLCENTPVQVITLAWLPAEYPKDAEEGR